MQTDTIAPSDAATSPEDRQHRLLTWLEEMQLRSELAELSRRVRKRPLVLFFGRNSFSDNTKYLFLRAAGVRAVNNIDALFRRDRTFTSH